MYVCMCVCHFEVEEVMNLRGSREDMRGVEGERKMEMM